VTAPHLQVIGVGGDGNVWAMTDLDPEEAGLGIGGPPPRPPGPVPAGFVPLDRVGVEAFPSPPKWPDSQLTLGSSPVGGSFLDDPGAPPRTKSAAWRWFFYALIGFLVGQLLGAVFGIVAGDVAGKSAAQMKVITGASVPPEWYVLSTLAGLWVGFFGAPWLASRLQGTRRFVADLGVRFRWIDLWGILIGLAGQGVIVALYAPFQHDIHNFNAPSQKLTGGAHGGGFVIVALATVLLAPFMEELFFRGLLFKALARLFTPNGPGVTRARGFGVVVAVVVDGLLFGLAHGEWVQLAGLALFGALLATISYRTGRQGMNMVSHASFNLVAVLAILSQRGGVIH
jgi:membrane protease YdiL (CAAX protease family)